MSSNFAQAVAGLWGSPPWQISFTPAKHPLPSQVDFAVIGAGFSGLAAAAWLRLLAPEKSVVVLESGRIGNGASGRTGGMALAESASGDLPGLGDVLAGLRDILTRLDVDCDLSLPGAWEIARKGGLPHSPISWSDSGTLRAVAEVPGGTLDPGKLVTGLARAAERLGAQIFENHFVGCVNFRDPLEIEVKRDGSLGASSGPSVTVGKIAARKALFATSALSLGLSGLDAGSHPKLTLAVRSAPIREEQLHAIGLAENKPFYTVDFPYLWGRTLPDRSIIWGAGLVDAPPSGDLQEVDIHSEVPSGMFANFNKRVRGLHPALTSLEITHQWGGPILFRDDWQPVFDWHPFSRNAIVLGAFAGHGVALSNYLGAWAAEILIGRRKLPKRWGRL